MKPRRSIASVKTLLPILSTGIVVEGVIVVLAALLRVWGLDGKPAHFDEGINGWFVDQMRAHGFYRYDPENYHGPVYFYVLFVSLSLLGRNLWALRLPAVLSSLASVWAVLRFDRFLGSGAARLSALAFALSPAAVFYGRYAIHESSLVLALLLTTLGILGLWKEGGRRDLIMMVSGVTLLLLIKETAVIHLACFLLAALCLLLWQHVVPSRPAVVLASRGWSNCDLGWCCALSLLALLFFYSGTFLNWSGVGDFFKAYIKWFHTGTGEGGHVKSEYQVGKFAFLNYYWLALMAYYEWPSLLGLLYAVRLAWPSPAILRYLAIYALGVLMAYSIVPYKTPWCIISIIWPFALLFGSAIEEGWRRPRLRVPSVVVALLTLGGSLFLTWKLNFQHCTDPKEPYVYVQTQPGIAVVTKPLLEMAERDPRNHALAGTILLESYYPLPWTLGDFTRIGYYGKDQAPPELTGDFIVALTSERAEVEKKIRQPYLRQNFHFRDSMEECTIWFKEDVFSPWFAEVGHGTPERVTPGVALQKDEKSKK